MPVIRPTTLLLAVAAAICAIALWETNAHAIPNCCSGAAAISPADSDIPHEHSFGVLSPGFPAGTVRRGGAAAAATPDAVPVGDHNHRDAHAWSVGPYLSNRWTFGLANVSDWAWDNHSLRNRAGAARAGAPFDSGHGFVDESGYGFQPPNPNTLRYRFGTGAAVAETGAQCAAGDTTDDDDNDPVAAGAQLDGFINDGCPANGAPETGAQCDNALDDDADTFFNDGCPLAGFRAPPNATQAVTAAAFGQWSNISVGAGIRTMTTGLEFVPVAPGTANANAEIEVLWRPLAAGTNGSTNSLGPGMRVIFNSNNTWNYGAVAGVGVGQKHFLSVALHEIGHVIGLDHTRMGAGAKRGISGIMRAGGTPAGCPGMVCRDNLDANSIHGGVDMYTIPTPDFGDAPDDPADPTDFPTLLASDGARAPTVAFESLGKTGGTPSSTRERDANITDIDERDDGCEPNVIIIDGVPTPHLKYKIVVQNSASARYSDEPDANDLFIAAWADLNLNDQWTPAAANPGELLFVHGVDPEDWISAAITTYAGAAPAASSGAANEIQAQVPVPAGTFDGRKWVRCRLVHGIPPGVPNYLAGDMGDEALVPLVSSPDNGGEIEDFKKELDLLFGTFSKVDIHFPPGAPAQTVKLSGPTTIKVDMGRPADTDIEPNGLEQVQTEIIQMELRGLSPTFGEIVVRVRDPADHPMQASTGEIEEDVNLNAGVLDLPPFTEEPSGLTARSFFDVFFELELVDVGITLHTHSPKHMETTIQSKPPTGETYESPELIDLFDDTEVLIAQIGNTTHVPDPPDSIRSFFGSPKGGAIDLVVNGVRLRVVTLPTDSLDIIARKVALAINTHSTLSGMGVTASAAGNRVTINGTVGSFIITDPGITHGTPDIQAPTQPLGDHSSVSTNDGSIRDDELLDFICEQINDNGGKVKDVKLMANSCYGGGLLDDMERVFGPGGACEGVPWVGGTASEPDKVAWGWKDDTVDDFPDEDLGSTWTDGLAGNSHLNKKTKKGVIRDGSTSNNVLQDLQTAGQNDALGPNGSKKEVPQVASGNGGHAVQWNTEDAKHEAVVFGGNQTDKRHSNNVENVETALKNTWKDKPHNIQTLDGGSEQDLKDAITAAAERLDANTEFVLYIDDHGDTHFDFGEFFEGIIDEPILDDQAWVFDLPDGWFDGMFGNAYAIPSEIPIPTLDLHVELCDGCEDWVYSLNGRELTFPPVDSLPGEPFISRLRFDYTDLRPGSLESNIVEIRPPTITVPQAVGVPGEVLVLSRMELNSGPINELTADQVLVPGQSAAFYNKGRSGEGVFVELLDNGRAVVYVFSYNRDGSGQSWMVGVGTQVGEGIIVHQLKMPTGATFGPGFDPADVVRTDFGSLFLRLPTCGTSDVPGSLYIYPETAVNYEDLRDISYTQLDLLADCTTGLGSANSGRSGSYFDRSHSGEGVIIQALTNGVVVVQWFTFDKEGNQMWVQGTGTFDGNTLTVENLFTTTGTVWGSGFDRTLITKVPWGRLMIVWDDCGHVTLTYRSTAGFGDGTLNMERLTNLMGIACTD